MTSADHLFDVAIVGAGLAGVVALTCARRAGLDAIVLERQGGVGGLWRQLPAWQDIQIGLADWTLGDLPLHGATQPHILANIEAWVRHFGLADGIRLNAPVQRARASTTGQGPGWELATPQGTVRARHLVAATGAHNTPLIPQVERAHSTVRELHSSALRDPTELAGRDVLVVGGGASAFDLLELCFQQGARRVAWAYRGLRWFVPTRKPKQVAGSVRGFARMQASGMSAQAQSAAIGADMRSRYEKFGIAELLPAHDFDVLHDQLMPGRAGVLEHFTAIERHRGSVAAIVGRTVTLSNGHRVEADLLLWGTGYGVDLSYFEAPEIASLRTLGALAARCGCIFRSLDAVNLYFPGVGLDGIGAAGLGYSLLCRSIMSHIAGTAQLDNEALGRKVNHFDIVDYLAPRDPASYPPDTWRAHYRDMALNTPDDQPYPFPGVPASTGSPQHASMAPEAAAHGAPGFLGVLMLDTRFPRIVGDIGNPATFNFPVRYAVVAGASPQRVVRERDTSLLTPFIQAGRALVAQGARAIATGCGFLVLFQRELDAALPVPVWTSSLLLVPELQAGLPAGRRVGVITIDAASLDIEHLRAAGADPATPVEGVAPGGSLQRSLLGNLPTLDETQAALEVVAAGRRLVARCPEAAAIVLECTNLPPYAAALRQALGLPVHDIKTLLDDRWRRLPAASGENRA